MREYKLTRFHVEASKEDWELEMAKIDIKGEEIDLVLLLISVMKADARVRAVVMTAAAACDKLGPGQPSLCNPS